MRILILAATYPPTRCGVGDYVRRLGHELQAVGHQVFVLTGEGEDPDHQHGEIDPGESVGPMPARRELSAPDFVDDGTGVRIARAVESWDWSCLDLVAASLGALRPDVLSLQYHGEDYLLHPAVCRVPSLAEEVGVATVTTLHNLQQPRGWSGASDPLDALLADSRRWICTNLLDERRLREHPRAGRRLDVITAGPCITAPRDRESPAQGGAFHVAYFGFLNPFKGIEYLLRAVARLRDEGRTLRLTLAAGLHTDAPGRLRRYAELIEAEIERLSLDGLLDRRGYIEDDEVSELLLGCDLAVFPFRDGLSGKNSSFWSTLHHGAPALTTRGPGLPAGLRHRENVLLAAIDDEESLAREIAWGMEHRDELERIGQGGRAFVEGDFDWSRLASSTVASFARATEAPREERSRG